jgi:hypothetical protein
MRMLRDLDPTFEIKPADHQSLSADKGAPYEAWQHLHSRSLNKPIEHFIHLRIG